VSRTKKIGRLKIGDVVATDSGGRVRITHSAPEPVELVYPYRATAPRLKVPGWYLIWRVPGEGREAGGVFDPEDEVKLG
jgi:hypothetical protein